jgi:uncharacterized protein YecT (DUF1311 family)
MHILKLLRVPLTVLLLGTVPAASADCETPVDAAEQLRCASAELRTSDQEINKTYQALRGLLGADEQLALRDEQRAWLRLRDQTCALDRSISDREQWFQALEAAPLKLTCVIRYTQARNKRLATWLAQRAAPAPDATGGGGTGASSTASPPAPPPPASAAATGYGSDSGTYEIFGKTKPVAGRWYFEVEVLPVAIAQRAEMALTVAVDQVKGPGGGWLYQIRRAEAKRDPYMVVIGIAIDLDEGFMYLRRQGYWPVAPGAVGGLPIKPRLQTVAVVGGSVDMTALLELGLIKTNFGERPFQNAPPPGYQAMAGS